VEEREPAAEILSVVCEGSLPIFRTATCNYTDPK
jgi:hypothetical protein